MGCAHIGCTSKERGVARRVRRESWEVRRRRKEEVSRGGKDWVMGAPVKEGVLRGGFGGKVRGAGVARRVRGVCAMVRDGYC